MQVILLLSSILLLPLIYCHSDHKDHDDPNWIKYLPNHVVNILKSRTTTIAAENNEGSILENNSTQSLSLEETDVSDTPQVMHDYGDRTSSNNSVRIGVPIGGIIIFILICYCCFRCCRNRQTISQGIVVQPLQPPPPDPHQPNIVIQHIHGQPPQMMQQPPPQIQHAPPQFQHAPYNQQFQQQPPYPSGYETRQMLQQEWSPHAPMNVPQQQYPNPDYPHDPSAPPPSYGKY